MVELLVVLTVIAIAAGIMVPRMGSSLGRRELRETAGRFAVTARTVRELAVARHQVFSIDVDLEHGYAMSMPGSQAGAPAQTLHYSWLKAEQWPSSIKHAMVETADGQLLAHGSFRFSFNPDGSSNGGNLRLQGPEERDLCAVLVYPHTGRVAIADSGNLPKVNEQVDLGD